MLRPLFHNQDLQSRLDQLGYVTVPFFDAATTREANRKLSELYEEAAGQGPFYLFTGAQDARFTERVFDLISELAAPTVQHLFDRPAVHFANCIIKEPDPDNLVPPHQDWAFTDESQHYSLTAWIPLMDVDMTRGAVGVIDGSHRFFDHPRASPRPHSVPPLTEHHLTLWPYMKPVSLSAGEAIIFDNRTIHASFPNRSGQTRMAVIVGIRHEEAALRHYYQVPEAPGDQLAVYATDPAFYFSYTDAKLGTLFERGECPEGLPLLETITRELNIPDARGLEELICSVPSNSWQPAVVDLLADRFPQLRPEPEHTATKPAAPAPEQPTRSFLETYSIPNILAEIRWRLFQRKRTG